MFGTPKSIRNIYIFYIYIYILHMFGFGVENLKENQI